MGNQPADLTENRFKIDLSPNPVEVRPWFDRVAVDLHGNHVMGRPTALPERPRSVVLAGWVEPVRKNTNSKQAGNLCRRHLGGAQGASRGVLGVSDPPAGLMGVWQTLML